MYTGDQLTWIRNRTNLLDEGCSFFNFTRYIKVDEGPGWATDPFSFLYAALPRSEGEKSSLSKNIQ
jgi:hypothetical protein